PRFSHPGYFNAPQWAVPQDFIATMGLPIHPMGIQGDEDHITLAAKNAILNMIDLLEHRGFTRDQAYIICSVAADLKISSVVNLPNVLVSALLPEHIFI
ncbi:MAG: acetamidase/formamidase family protein, partial [Desulfobacterales bacterium]|nr:acetamidase/formamidase family protein [Desulfobacterales bacterium]